MARRHDSDSSGDDTAKERRTRDDRKPSSRSHRRRSDSSDSDRGRWESRRERGRKTDELDRVRVRRSREKSQDPNSGEEGEVGYYRGSEREASGRGRGEQRERKREMSPRIGRNLDQEDGELVTESRKRDRARDEMRERRRDVSPRIADGEDKKEDGELVNDSRKRDRARDELRERKRDVSPRISDGEGKKKVGRSFDEEDGELVTESRRGPRIAEGEDKKKVGRSFDEEDGELDTESRKRDRRHRNGRHRERRHERESSEEDERSRSRKERNGKSRDEPDRRRREDRRHKSDSRREDRDEQSKANKEVDDDAKRPKAIELNPPGDAATLGRTGGVYIPPFKLARMMKEVEDKASAEYQRLTWDALRKSINGLVNKVNATNIKNIIPELLNENLIRGRGIFCRAVMKSQFASPGFTDVFAALVAVVNTKFPQIGDLLLRRIVLQLRRAYKRNDKPQLIAAVKFVAHLVNQMVAYELIALELLTLLLDQPTDDSVEVAVGFVTECGAILQDLSPKGLHGIFERFRGILHEGEIDKRVQFLIEGLFAIRKAKFQGHPAVRPELDLVEPEDQLTHEISIIDEDIDQEVALDIFRPDPDYIENEKKYDELKKSILGEESEEEEGSDEGSDSGDEDEEEEDDEDDEEQMEIKDQTETNLVNLRRTIYLTIMSSVDFEEAGHKLLKIKLEPGQEMELCIMLLECCSQERTYLRYYGLLGQRFCMINKIHQDNFEKCFVQQYSMIHRLETNKLRNVAKFFAHLLGTDALPWHVLSYIRLTEEDTTSSSRIFIKILFQELSEHLGIRLLNERLNDPAMQDSYESIFPRDNPRNTRFAINFFTSIGLGGITEALREYLKNMPRIIMQQQQAAEEESGSGSDSESSSGSDSSSSESESSSSSSSEESDREKRRKRRR